MVSNEVKREQIPQMDWQQVALNGGPPCFFVEGPQYCGRAERWHGHGNTAFHDYVSLGDLLATVRREALKEAVRNIHRASFIEARHCSIEFLNGAEWARNKLAEVITPLEVSAHQKEGMNG